MSVKMPIELIPKIELHCHLLGVIGPTLLRRVFNRQAVLIDPDQLEAIYPVLGTAGFNDWLKLTSPYQAASAEILLELLALHVNDLIGQHVVYTELMVSPKMLPPSIDQMLETFSYIRRQITALEQGTIQVEFIMVIPRTLPDDKLRADTQAFIELYRAGFIVGVAIVGMETGESLRRFRSCFHQLKNQGIKLEIHTGEHYGVDSVWEVLKLGVVDRIGHGIRAFDDSKLVNELQKKQIHLEFCPTSNLRTGSVATLEQHPIRQAKELGLNFSVNTDDPGLFECSMNSEFQLISDCLSFTEEDFNRIYQQSRAAVFAKDFRGSIQ